MLRMCVLDFKGSLDQYLPLVEFVYNNSYHSSIVIPPYEALHGRKYRSSLFQTKIGERKIEGPDLIRETIEKGPLIQARLRTAFSRQQSYVDQKRKDVQLNIGDHVFLKISSIKGVMRFGKKKKLAPRYIGPFEILDRVGSVSYRLALPPCMSQVYLVFYISLLRKYITYLKH